MVTFDYYRIFYYVAQYKSFTKAAEILDNNQPNITRCMNILENELECKLFIRSNRGIKLTPEGKQLYQHVSIACKQLQAGESELLKTRMLQSGFVSIGTSETALHLFLLDKLEKFHQTFPNVHLKISNYSTPQAIISLEKGLVDFAVVTTPVNIRKPYVKHSLYKFRELLVAGPKYKDIVQNISSIKDLSSYPFITLGKDSSTRKLHMSYFLEHNTPFHPDIEAATSDQLIPMISHNLGIGFCPENMAAKALEDGAVIPLTISEPLPEREIYVVYDGTQPQSIASKKLIELFQQ